MATAKKKKPVQKSSGFKRTGSVKQGLPGLKLPMPAQGEVVLFSYQPPLLLTCPLGDGPAQPAGGTAVYDTVQLPGRKSALQLSGVDLETLAIPVMFDGLVDRESVEPQIEALKRLARPQYGAPRGTPGPKIRMYGQVPHLNKEWRIVSFDWGDATWHNLRRVFQVVTVNLTEAESADQITTTAAAAKSSAPRARRYTVKKGDTLARIAVREMGAATPRQIAVAVADLKKANKLRDAKALKVGAKIVIPAIASGSFKGSAVGTGL
jgi:LysM repeat protein